MMQCDRQLVRYLAELSNIHCSEDEQERLLHDLEEILQYVELLQELDTEDVPPCNNVLEGMVNVFRDDETGDTISRDSFLSNAPDHIDGMTRIPPILNTKS